MNRFPHGLATSLLRYRPNAQTHGYAHRLSTHTAATLLATDSIAGVLRRCDLTATDDLKQHPDALLALLREFSAVCSKPLPSDVFLRMRTAEDVAAYYEADMSPLKHVQPHTLNLLDADAVPEITQGSVEVVREKIEASLPANLSLDPKLFQPRPVAIMGTGKYPENIPRISKTQLNDARREKRRARRAERLQIATQ